MNTIDKKAITTIRTLSIDAVEQANSGHPGLPLGTAPLAYTLWDKVMQHNPKNPNWVNRDRFILSAGHGSALLYSLLHLTGYDLPLEEVKAFRQLDSKTPGHPEYGHTPGVEATTGPLGHGFAMGVGMAIAETALAAKFNQPDFPIIDHYTYALVSDGDLMEGVSAEAASLAGTMQLGKLIYLYDDNNITIEGTTDIAFTENVQARFEAYGWQVLRVNDSEDLVALINCIELAKQETAKPSLIIVKTHIGFASPKQDSPAAHGEPLGKDAIITTKQALGVADLTPFYIPSEVQEYFAERLKVHAEQEQTWQELFDKYAKQYPTQAQELQEQLQGKLPANLATSLSQLFIDKTSSATRDASGEILQLLAKNIPALIGGSADLGPSNKTLLKGLGDFSAQDRTGRNLHFGVREHATGTILNGIALHGGFIPYGATFLVFVDFMRPALRLAALMGIHSIFVLTHDSIAVGEDGPTHQPIEHTMSLRIIPNLDVLRPADALETAAAWHLAVSNKRPVSLLLTRQKLPVLAAYQTQIASGVAKGAYKLGEELNPDITILASGSEVHLALAGAELLKTTGIKAQVVSMPCWEYFEQQTAAYKSTVIPNHIPTMAIEAGVTLGWSKYTKNHEHILGIDTFGASGPGDKVYAKFGFTAQAVAELAKKILKK